MNRKFKIGDVVKIIESCSHGLVREVRCYVGTYHSITKADDGYNCITLSGIPRRWTWSGNNLILDDRLEKLKLL